MQLGASSPFDGTHLLVLWNTAKEIGELRREMCTIIPNDGQGGQFPFDRDALRNQDCHSEQEGTQHVEPRSGCPDYYRRR